MNKVQMNKDNYKNHASRMAKEKNTENNQCVIHIGVINTKFTAMRLSTKSVFLNVPFLKKVDYVGFI